ncbi:MAG TPA: hypothetical protein VGG75_04005 [Trebonia sp.]
MEAPQRPLGTSVLARLNHPVAASVIALLAWAGFVLARLNVWAKGDITYFIMSGVTYSHSAQMYPRIQHVSSAGYDGQFYYRFALNPFNWHPTAYGITVDHNYRYTRIGYPLVTWLLSAGHAAAVPVMLVMVNLACVAAIGWLGAVFARDSGRHALWGLLFVAYFGLVISVGRDTAEPLADACLLAALLLYRRGRYVWAALLLMYGVITNEPILIMAVGIALTRLWAMFVRPRLRRDAPRVKPGLEDLIWVLPGVAYVVLQVAEKLIVPGTSGGSSDVTSNITVPFTALVRGLFTDFRLMSWTHLGMYDFNLIEFIALAVAVVSGLLVLRATTAPVHERVGFACFVLIEIVMASWQYWGSVFGDGRTYIESFLMAIVLLLATPAARPDGAKWWQAVSSKRLGSIAAVAVVVLILVARRRILFQ